MRLPVTFGAILALLLVTGCGGGAAPAPTTPGPSAPGPSVPGATAAVPTGAGAAIVCNSSGDGVAVDISDFKFNPASTTVSANSAVTFTNNDSTTHTVTFDSGPDCGSIASGGASQTILFTQAGSFAYHCTIHPSMKGTVVVN